MEVFAIREFYCPGKKVVLTIYKPVRDPLSGDRAVRWTVSGLKREISCYSYGVDDIQVIVHAIRSAGSKLYSSEEYTSGVLKWSAGNTQTDLGLIVDP